MEYGLAFIIAAFVIGILMAWGVGSNDLANIMSTTMASKAISIRKAIIIAIVFEVAGAMLGGVHVTNTIRSGIINMQLFSHDPQILIEGMLASLLAGMVWILFASFVGMPVSITNAIIGAIVGFGTIVLGVHAIHWPVVGKIAVSWICSPILAGTAAFFMFGIVRRTILASNNPPRSARYYLPFFFFLVGIVLSAMIVLKDLTEQGYLLNFHQRAVISIVCGLFIVLLGRILCQFVHLKEKPKRYERFEYVEKLFGILMGFTACAMVFAHGSNDVAIAMGPVAAIYSIIQHNGSVAMTDPLALWILLIGSVGVILGMLMYGRKVIATVGHGITALTPSRAFSATIAAACTVILSTSAGIPVSATQTLVGGVLGVGLARGIGALNLIVIRNIILSWVVTVPAAAILSIVFFEMIKGLFLL